MPMATVLGNSLLKKRRQNTFPEEFDLIENITPGASMEAELSQYDAVLLYLLTLGVNCTVVHLPVVSD